MVHIIMVNITFNISAITNMTEMPGINTIAPYRYCVTPEYNNVLLGIVILLAIPYLFNLNGRIAKILKVEPRKDDDPFGTKLYKRLFSDFFYIGNAFYLALFFYLYNIFFA